MADEKPSITFKYIKSNDFRVVSADGAHGGLTPQQGKIFISFFTERFAIPRKVTFELQPNGVLGEEILERREAETSIVREVEVGVVMDVKAARALAVWLQDKVSQLEKVMPQKEPASEVVN